MFTFGGTPEQVFNNFLFPDILLRKSVSDAPRHNRQLRSENIRSQRMSYTGINNGNNGHGTGYQHLQLHSGGGTTASSNFLFPPSVDFRTAQQQ